MRMREIKFRGREKETNKWVFGYVRHWKNCFGDEWHIQGENDNVHVVIPATVGQYSGQTDKRKREIYDGDIVKNHDGNKGVVHWDETFSGFRADMSDGLIFTLTGLTASMFTVVGNVHDNAELLNDEPRTLDGKRVKGLDAEKFEEIYNEDEGE